MKLPARHPLIDAIKFLSLPDGARLSIGLLDLEVVMGLGCFSVDLVTREVRGTHAFLQMWGLESDQFLNLELAGDRVHPDDVKLFHAWFDAHMTDASQGKVCQLRVVSSLTDVRLFRLFVIASIIKDQFSQVLIGVKDVTQPALANHADADSIPSALDIFENAAWGMFRTTSDGQYIRSNPTLARIYGYETPEVMRTKLKDIACELYVDPLRRGEFIRLMTEQGSVAGFESQVYRADSSIIWISESCREVRGSDGCFCYYEGTVEDITQRKNAENSLREIKELELQQHQRFKAALNNMSQGLCMADGDGGIIVHNQRFIEIYGLSQSSMVTGSKLADIMLSTSVFDASTKNHAVADLAEIISSCRRTTISQELNDGRIIVITHEPMDDGGFVDTFSDMTAQRRADARIAHMASHDSMTDLPNRVLFHERLDAAIHRVTRGETCAVLCLDLDQFKSINDTLGHPFGDALLLAVTERLNQVVRKTDTIARLGGDEFAIIQSCKHQLEESTFLANRLLLTLNRPYEIQGHHVVIGASIGIAISPNDSTDPDQLLKCADLALYRAKAEGRGCYRYFEQEMNTSMQARHLLEQDLRKAIIAHEFELYYQPVVDMQSTIHGFEALIRWNSPQRGLVSPAEFIPLAEEIGLICDIGAWVMEAACLEARKWPSHIIVAVNVSAVQLRNYSIVEVVKSALQHSGLSPERLEIEITETAMIADKDRTCDILHQLKALGLAISMDDFGTGYSSLSYLRSFPFDKIKIDQSFIRGLGNDSDCDAIVHAVISLCDSLAITATAEGVETEYQLAQLKVRKCHQMQGYLFSKPIRAPDIRYKLADIKNTDAVEYPPSDTLQMRK